MTETTRKIQLALRAQGFDPGLIDGVHGPATDRAIVAFKVANGLQARPYLGPVTLSLLFGSLLGSIVDVDTPWVNEISKYMNVHETRDYSTLSAWLKSDGRTLGDPRKLPWCGDAVETAIKLALPNEPFIGKVKANPYYALNWLDFGDETEACLGAITVCVRPGGGHICFLQGLDKATNRIRVRGGNQGNSISDTWMDADRVRGYRWPKTYTGPKLPVPLMDSHGAVLSTNEH